MTILNRSDANYADERQAVVDRYNAIWTENQKGKGIPVDWGALFAELIHAYCSGAKEGK